MQEIVQIRNLGKSYAGREIFSKVNMTIKPYEPIVIMGENGCGKSTLLKIIAGILNCSEGEIKYNKDLKIAYMPDRFPKLPFSIESYLSYMGNIQGVSKKEVSDYIDDKFNHLNIPLDYRKQKIYKCSKGTIQKVNIMQTLITKPDLLILDEPFAGLDEDSEDSFIDLLKKTAAEGTSLVMTCHEKLLAQRFAENIYFFNDRKVEITNVFVKRFCVKFFTDKLPFNFDDAPEGITFSRDNELYEALIEKDKLEDVLRFLFAQSCEIHSVNLKYIVGEKEVHVRATQPNLPYGSDVKI